MTDKSKREAKKNVSTQKRERLSVDLEAYPDVKRMLLRLENDYKNVDRTAHVIDALRKYLTEKGYARKKDLAA